jgi:hypothetical protein
MFCSIITKQDLPPVRLIGGMTEAQDTRGRKMTKRLMIAVAVAVVALVGRCVCAQETPSGKTAHCAELVQDLFIDLKEVVKAGCTPSKAQIDKLLENPIGNLIAIPFQYDYITVKGPHISDSKTIQRLQITPTFPISVDRDWNLINRIVFPFLSIPFDKGFGDLIGMAPGGILSSPNFQAALQDPFERTSGFGDMVYVGVVAPKESIKIESTGGVFLWGVGATAMFPTASEDILGTGKYSLGPTGVLGYLGKEWVLGIFPQHWWSVGGGSGRSNVNYTNLQYFLYYSPPGWDPEAAWKFGMSPNITINWAAKGDKLTLPVGLGVSRMVDIAGLPVSVGGEVYYSVIHPDDKLGSRWDARLYFTVVIPTFMF